LNNHNNQIIVDILIIAMCHKSLFFVLIFFDTIINWFSNNIIQIENKGGSWQIPKGEIICIIYIILQYIPTSNFFPLIATQEIILFGSYALNTYLWMGWFLILINVWYFYDNDYYYYYYVLTHLYRPREGVNQ